MTIEDRAEAAALKYVQETPVNIGTDSPKFRALVRAFVWFGIEVSREQRKASARAVESIDRDAWARDAAIRAVVEAEID